MLIFCPFYILNDFRELDLESSDQLESSEGQSENVVVEKEKPWLGESQVALTAFMLNQHFHSSFTSS